MSAAGACARLLALVALVAALGAGCGGGGPTAPRPMPPPPPPPPPPPEAGIEFTPAGMPGAMTVSLDQGDSGEDTVLLLEIEVTDVTDLFGLGFDLAYPTDILDWNVDSETEGGFLSVDGERVELLIRERPAGTLIIGLSRLGDVGGVDGSGLLLTLEFTGIEDGSGSFSFSENVAFDSGGGRLDGTTWLAGEVEVTL